jgi:hypothetical protein
MPYLFVATNITKFIFLLVKKISTNFKRIIEFFTKLIVIKLSKIFFFCFGSGIRKIPFLDPGSRSQKCTGFHIRIHNTDFNAVLVIT